MIIILMPFKDSTESYDRYQLLTEKVYMDWGPVHTNPFSNENGAVSLRFQKDLRPHLSFSYRFRPSTLQRCIRLKTLLYPQCVYSNELDACAFQYIGPGNWRHSRFFVGARSCLFGWRHRFQIASLSPSTLENSVFKKQRFQIAPLWRILHDRMIFLAETTNS